MAYTNIGLVKFCENVLSNRKTAYLLGGLGHKMTTDNIEKKCNQYKYNAERKPMLLKYIDNDRYGFDCVGLIKAYRFDWNDGKYNYINTLDMNDQGVLRNAKVKGTIESIPSVVGLAVVMDGHIGVYDGKGNVYECTSSVTFTGQECGGVCRTKLSDRKWTHWCEIPFIEYIKEVEVGDKIVYKDCYTGVWGYNGNKRSDTIKSGTVIAITNFNDFSNFKACNYIVNNGSTVVFVNKGDIV